MALSGLIAFYAFRHIESLYSALYAWAPHATIKWLVFLIAFAFVSLSATLIGGTLPVLARYVVDRDEGLKAALGRLYSINTLGAAAGALLMIGLVWVLGYEAGYHLALALNAVTGVAALLLARREQPAPRSDGAVPAPPPPAQKKETLNGRLLLPAFALSGFCALAYEVVWFRLLDFLLLGRLTTFACVLSVYLLGISLGSLAFSRWSPAGLSDLKLFVVFEALLGLLGLLSLPLLSWVSGWGHRPVSIATGFVILFAMTLLLGGLFPLAGKLYAGPLRLLGRTVGNVYSANTVGSVLGSFLAGFVLIPTLGTSGTLLLIAGLNLLVAGGVAEPLSPAPEPTLAGSKRGARGGGARGLVQRELAHALLRACQPPPRLPGDRAAGEQPAAGAGGRERAGRSSPHGRPLPVRRDGARAAADPEASGPPAHARPPGAAAGAGDRLWRGRSSRAPCCCTSRSCSTSRTRRAHDPDGRGVLRGAQRACEPQAERARGRDGRAALPEDEPGAVRRHHVGLDDPRERGQPAALHGGALPRGTQAPAPGRRGAGVVAAQRWHQQGDGDPEDVPGGLPPEPAVAAAGAQHAGGLPHRLQGRGAD